MQVLRGKTCYRLWGINPHFAPLREHTLHLLARLQNLWCHHLINAAWANTFAINRARAKPSLPPLTRSYTQSKASFCDCLV